jgi:hypothetical protein
VNIKFNKRVDKKGFVAYNIRVMHFQLKGELGWITIKKRQEYQLLQ